MARKLIARLGNPEQMFAKVYRDPETYGFVVEFYRAGKHLKNADYETDERADAMQTAALQCEMAAAARA
jgi:hypothetical protein